MRTAEAIPDGYRLVRVTKEKAGPVYEVLYVRTIAGAKWVCWNLSKDEASIDCAIKTCETCTS